MANPFAQFASSTPAPAAPQQAAAGPSNPFASFAPPATAAATGTPQAFAAAYRDNPGLQAAAHELGVAPEAILAQLGLETGWGKSVIPGTNNLGNIKDMTGAGVRAVDNQTGSNDAYRKYGSTDEFFQDYGRLLKTRYPGVVGAGGDIGAFTGGLKGYAEDPNYASKVASAYQMVGGQAGAAAAPPSFQSASLTRPSRTTTDPNKWTFTPGAEAAPDATKRSGGQFAGDIALKVGQGVVDLGEGAVGLGDIATLGVAGKALAKVGFDPQRARDMLEGLSSPKQQALDRAVSEASSSSDGFLDGAGKTLQTIFENPAYIPGAIVESLPSMLAAGGGARALAGRIYANAVAESLAKGATEAVAKEAGKAAVDGAASGLKWATAAGEGVQSSGQIAEQSRQQGRAWEDYVLPALAAGAGTAVIGRAAGAVPGFGEAETAAFTGSRGAAATGGRLVRTAKGMVQEGLLEEAPQSAQEQMFQNIAQGKDPGEGVGAAAGQGLVVGTAMGGGEGALSPAHGVAAKAGQAGAAAGGVPPAPNGTAALPAPAGGTALTAPNAAAQPTPEELFAGRLGAALEHLKTPGWLASVAATDPDTKDEILHAMAVARNPTIDQRIRDTALSQLEETLQRLAAARFKPGNSLMPANAPAATGPVGALAAPDNTIEGEATRVDDTSLPPPPRAGFKVDAAGNASPAYADDMHPVQPLPKVPPTLPPPAAADFTAGPDGTVTPARNQALINANEQNIELDDRLRSIEQHQRDEEMGQTPGARAAQAAQAARAGTQPQAPAATPKLDNASSFALSGHPASVDVAAHEAATSPNNSAPAPTEAQREAGNYKKGHARIGGLDISIEHPEGVARRAFWPKLKAHYGYIRGTEGRDGDHVDVFVKPGTPDDYNGPVFIVDQQKKEGGFDEHKTMLGYADEASARAAYLAAYPKGWKGLGGVTQMDMPAFKTWLADGDKSKPAGKSDMARTVHELSMQSQKDAGWNSAWPFIPADLLNGDFRKLIANDPSLSDAEKAQIFAAGKKLGVVPKTDEKAAVTAPESSTTTQPVEPQGKAVEQKNGENVPAAGAAAAAPNLASPTGGSVEAKGGGRVFAGKAGRGLPLQSMREQAARLSREEPGYTWKVEEAPELGHGIYKAVGEPKTKVKGRVAEPQARKSDLPELAPAAEDVRRELTDVFGEDGIAALEREGILHIIDSANAPEAIRKAMEGGPVWQAAHLNGKAYLFTDALRPGSAARVLLHEIGEHYGLKEMLGDDRYAKLAADVRAMAAGGNKVVRLAWKTVEENYPELKVGSEKFIAEVIAWAGEHQHIGQQTWWKKLMDVIKAWLVKKGFKGVTSDQDLKMLLRASLNKVMRDAQRASQPVEINGEPAMASRGPQVEQVELRGNELDSYEGDTLRDKARDFGRKELQSKTFTNADTGWDISIGNKGLKKAISGARVADEYRAIAALPDMLEHAVLAKSEDNQRADERTSIPLVHHFYAPLRVGNKDYVAHMVVKETKEGERFYDQSLDEISPAVSPADPASGSNKPEGAEGAGPGWSIRQLAAAVKNREHAAGLVTRGTEEGGEEAPQAKKSILDSAPESLFDAAHLTPDQRAAIERVFGKPLTYRERARKLFANAGLKLTQGLVDQFAPLKDLGMREYILARMTKASDGTLEAALRYGVPHLKDDIFDIDTSKKGFIDRLKNLAGEQDLWAAWMAAQRAEQLKAQGKENLFTDADIRELKGLAAGKMKDGRNRADVYRQAMTDLNEFNKAVLDIAEARGIIDPESRKVWESGVYIPFYRNMEDGTSGPSIKSGLVNQYAFKKLKGGTANLREDLLANIMQNWAHLLSASAKNAAAESAIKAAEKAGIAYQVPSGTKGAVRYLDKGVEKSFNVEDPFILDAITAMEPAGLPTWAKPLAAFKKYLTIGVTASPAFKIRNLIRDSIQAIGTADLSYNPAKNIAQGVKAAKAGSDTFIKMMANGGIIRFGAMLDGDRADHLRRLIESGVDAGTVLDTPAKVREAMQKAWEAYNELGDRSENANRAALYEQSVAKGKDPLEAMFASRDLMDFSMSGAWPAVRFLTQVTPFLNARLQGLYKLGRAAKEDPKRFGYVVGTVALASMALLMAYKDDEDWKKREDWDRDNYWWFKIGDTAFRIPKPFEVGALGTLAERSLEYMVSDEMTGKRFADRIGSMISNTFSLNPVPQLVKPLVDVYANKDGFTGRPIETEGMQNLRPQDRVGRNTSEVAKWLGQMGLPEPLQGLQGRYSALSPVQIDELIRGYFGWLGSTATTAIDYGVRPMLGRPAKPEMTLKDVFLAGNFAESLPAGNSRYVTQLYDQAKEVEQAYASYRDALKKGDHEEAASILKETPDLQAKHQRLEAGKKVLAQTNAEEKRIADGALSPAEKRAALEGIAGRRNRAAEAAVQR